MALILNIETATKNCSVSLGNNGELISLKELNSKDYSHAEKLHPFIKEVLKESNKTIDKIDAIAVSKGPGSYTGLRIGVSTAKGLAYTLNKPLIGIETLESLANAINVSQGEKIIPMLDARRMEVYTSTYNHLHKKTKDIEAMIIDQDSFKEELTKNKLYFIGDGALKCKEIIKSPNAYFDQTIYPSAKDMVELSYKKFINKNFEDTAYFEPFYLKDFIVTPSKKNLIKKPCNN